MCMLVSVLSQRGILKRCIVPDHDPRYRTYEFENLTLRFQI